MKRYGKLFTSWEETEPDVEIEKVGFSYKVRGGFVEDAELGMRFAEAFAKRIDGLFMVNGVPYQGQRREAPPPPPPPKEPEPIQFVTAKARGAYSYLGLQVTATAEEVRSAYRVMAKRLHPDLGGDERDMKRLNAAYSLLVREGLA